MSDATFELSDDVDSTKRAKFDLVNIATATTRTYTFPSISGQLLTEGAAQTLNNKSFGASNSMGSLSTLTGMADDEFVLVTDNLPNLGKMTWPTFITQLRTAGANALNGVYQPLHAMLTAIAGLADPNADRILFWDDSAGTLTWLTLGTNLSITGTTINASVSGGTTIDLREGTTSVAAITALQAWEGLTASDQGSGVGRITLDYAWKRWKSGYQFQCSTR